MQSLCEKITTSDVASRLDIPALGGGWAIDTAISLPGGSIVLYLKQADLQAFWLCDGDGKFVSGDAGAVAGAVERDLAGPQTAADRARMNEVAALASLCAGNYAGARGFMAALERSKPFLGSGLLILATQTAFNIGKSEDIEDLVDRLPATSKDRAAVRAAYKGRIAADKGDWATGQKWLAKAITTSPVVPSWTRNYLCYCARRTSAAVPGSAKAELKLFCEAADAFFRGEAIPWQEGDFPAEALAYYWVRSFTFVAVQGKWEGKIAGYDLAPEFVDALRDGSSGVSRRIANAVESPVSPTPCSERVRDIAAGVRAGGKPVLCPFSGRVSICRDTLDQHVFFHKNDDRAVVILSDRHIRYHPSDQFWAFPQERLLLSAGKKVRADLDFAVTMARVVANVPAVLDYLAAPERKSMVSETAMGHIGHYIWNVISGWEPLFKLVDPGQIDAVVTHGLSHFFGGVTELYRDEVSRAGMTCVVDSDDHLFKLMLQSRSTLYGIRDSYVSEALAERIRMWCEDNTSIEFKQSVLEFRDGPGPVLTITLRTGNRSWLGQAEGFSRIIGDLGRTFPGLKVIIDGLNALPAGTATALPMSLQEELDVAAKIMELCPGVRIFNSVGCSVAESVVLSYACDVFISPVGAGLAKLRWIANKPGVGFSNLTFMHPDNTEGHLYSHYRQNQTEMLYLESRYISDLDEGPNGWRDRANFEIDWHEVSRLAAGLIGGAR